VLTIVPLYQGMAGYVRAAKADPSADRGALWEQHVVDPYWTQWGAGQHNEARVRAEISRPIDDLDGLEEAVNALSGSGVEELVRDAYVRICRLLPYHEGDTAICIAAADPRDRGLVADLNGVVGGCVGANTMLTIHPAGEGWQEWVPYVLAHERHHSAWGYHYYYLRGGTRRDLLISLISEGTADAFARQLCPDLHPRWLEALSPEEEARQWAAIQPLLDVPDLDGELYRRTFFGDAEAGVPAFAGYTVGYHIVQAYQSTHPGESVAEWTTRDPEAVLAESGYRPGQGTAR
jgi:uncharacterized protein YjaZ